MKTLQIELTDAQHALFEQVAGQLPGMTAEKLVGPMALNRMGMFDTSESVVEAILSGWKAFTVEGHLPDGDFSDIYHYGANSRPIGSAAVGGSREEPPASEVANLTRELIDLSTELAYELAESRLDSFCDSVEMEGVPENLRDGWRDLDSVEDGEGRKHDLERAVQWLDSRGLLERWRTDEPNLVRVRPLFVAKSA